MTRPLTPESFEAAALRLADSDPVLASVLDTYGMPAFWSRPPGFATLCLFIVEQQVSLASAKAVFERIHDLVGQVEPETILATPPDDLKACGLTRQKLRYVRSLAAGITAGQVDLDSLESLSDHEARAELLTLTGIGPWTADVYLLSALRRPDIWPVGDRALQVGAAELDGASPKPLELMGEAWVPWRSVAARLIWHAYLQRRGRAETIVSGIG